MRGKKGRIAFTNSLLEILNESQIIESSTKSFQPAGRNEPSQFYAENSPYHPTERENGREHTNQDNIGIPIFHPAGRVHPSQPNQDTPTFHPTGRGYPYQPSRSTPTFHSESNQTSQQNGSTHTFHPAGTEYPNQQFERPPPPTSDGKDYHSACPQSLHQQQCQYDASEHYNRGRVVGNRYGRMAGN